MLGSDLRIRRFTPVAARILKLIPADVGRPITDLRLGIQAPDLGAAIGEVLESVTVKEIDVPDLEGRWYSLSVRPYRTSDNRIDGAVMILVDIDEVKRGFDQGQTQRDFMRTVVELAGDAMAVVDRDHRIRLANAAFAKLFLARDGVIEGSSLDGVIAGLPAMLDGLGDGENGDREIRTQVNLGHARGDVWVAVRTLRSQLGRELRVLRVKPDSA
jgi:PAS domain-containing protein